MIRPFAVVLLLAAVLHGEESASDAAVGFLIDVARHRIDLAKDTALAEGTTREKRETIRNELAALGDDLKGGDLNAVREKVDGELAGVLVSQITDFDPNQLKVHAVALIRRDGLWRPAPVPASFENTGLTYLPELSQRATALENWLLDQRNVETARLRGNILADLLAEIHEAIPRESLAAGPPETIALTFIEAVRDRKLPLALACLGGLEDPLPPGWHAALRHTASAFRSPDETAGAWELLRSRTAVHALVPNKSKTRVGIALLDPVARSPSRPRIALLDFTLERGGGGLWRLELPKWLLEDPDDDFATSDPDAIRTVSVPEDILAACPPVALDEPDDFARSLARALAATQFAKTITHLARPEQDAYATLGQAARLWNSFHASRGVVPFVLDLKVHAGRGRLLLTDFDLRSPEIDSALVTPIDLVHGPEGWLLAPWLDHLTEAPEPDEVLARWQREALKLDQDAWLKRLRLHAVAAEPADGTAPSGDETRKAVEAWLTAAGERDPRAALAAGAALDDDDGPGQLFKAVGQAFRIDSTPEILAIHREGGWAAASVRHVPTRKTKPFELLYPVIATDQGPRVLAEAVLETPDTRTREFLNKAVWERLDATLPKESIDELRRIAQAHAELREAP